MIIIHVMLAPIRWAKRTSAARKLSTPKMNVVPTLDVTCFFWKGSNTACFVASDPSTKTCAVIDSCADFDFASGSVWFDHAKQVTFRFVFDS